MQALEEHNTFGRSSLIATHMYVYICGFLSDIFVTWDGATLKFESN